MSVDQHNNHLNDMGPPPDPVMEVPPPKEIKVLESADDIQHRRTEVPDHYSLFKDFAKTKRDRLEEARQFQYFKRDADELEIWILEKLQTAAEESFRDPTNLQAKIQKHDAFVAEVQAHSNAITKLDKTGNDMIQHDHYEKETIRKRLDRLHDLWDRLFAMLENKGIKLQQTLKLLQFVRKCDEMLYWIKDKIQFVSTDDLGADLEHVEVMQRKFDEFLKELKSRESRVLDINHEANALIDECHPEQQQIHGKRDEVNEAWHKLGTLTSTRGEALFGAQQIQRFYRDIDETLAWMGEKELTLATDDFGRDLNNVQALQRKHEGTERDLAALESKMDKLGTETNRLCQLYPEKSEDIAAKVDEARGRWEALKLSVEQRKRGLDRSYNRHRFMADYRELVEWTNGQALIQSSELAKDVAGAEALLEQHQEHKGEIEARTDSFKQTAETGQRLLDEDIDEADEIRQCLQNLAMEQTGLNNLWEERRILYEQCMDLQLFYRDTEQAESWMTKQEAFLQNDDLGDSLDAVESLLKKHEDFEKSLAAQEEKIHALDEFATKLIEGGHYAAEDVAKRREKLLARRRHLMDRMAQRRERLKESYRLHSFDRDCDEMLGWIQSYLDPTNIRGKLQKHGNFEQELRANRNRLDETNAPGQELIQSGHYANEHIQIGTGHQDNAHVSRIMHDLGLSSESIATHRQIGHGSQQQAQEMVASSEEEGADQTDTLSAFGDDEMLMTELLDEVPPFDLINQGIVDTIHLAIMARHGVLGGNIRTVDVRVVDGHGNCIYTPPPAAHVPQLLEQFIQDVNSAIGQASTGLMEARVVAAWAQYKSALIQSSELAKDVAGAEALLEQHQEHKGEIETRTDSFKQTAETGQRLLDEDIDEADEIRQCLQNLATEQTSLNNLWEERRILYEQCMDLQLFYRDMEQAESWMTKQELLARRRHLMDRMAQRRERLKESYRLHSFDRDCDEMLGWIQSYLDPTNIRGKLQKHGNFEQELRANRNRLDETNAPGQELIQSGHYANEHIQESLGMTFKELFKCWCVTASDRSVNYRRLVAGGLAGSVTFFFIYPLGFSRTRLAVDMGKDVAPSEFNGLVHYFAKHDGIFGLCRAFVLLMCYIFPYRSFYFGLFDSFKVFVATTADENCTSGGGRESVPFLAAFCIGQCSAFLAVLFSHTPDTVRRRLMMQPGKNVLDYANAWHCIRHNAILRRFHLPPLVLEPDARRNYDAYLQEANNGDVSTFVNFLVFQQQSSSERMQ